MENLRSYLQQPYARIVIPDESGSFHAEILEFPGCYAQGDTPNEAYENLEQTAIAWIETCLERGQEVPEPANNVGYSGKLALRLPRSIHRRASEFAERDRTSLNTFVVSAVSERVGVEQFYKLFAQRFERHVFTLMGAAFCQFATTTNTTTLSSPPQPVKVTSTAESGRTSGWLER